MDLDKIIKGLNEKIKAKEAFDSEELAIIEQYKPDNCFIVYGTLAPNRPNHHIVEMIKGTWIEGIVRGKLESKGWGADLGYNGFKPTTKEEQQVIQAFILFSDELNAHWQRLDDFEGSGYQRMLAKYELHKGEMGIGNIYALND